MRKILFVMLFLFMLTSISYAETTPNVTSTNGRFVIVTSPHVQRATFLLDTRTGKTWTLVVDSEDEYVWQPTQYSWYKPDGSYGGNSINVTPAK